MTPPRGRLSVLMFGLMYRVGFTPWDGHPIPEQLERLAARPNGGRALDVGCGTGDTAIHLAGAGWKVTAVDFVEVALRRARKKARRAEVSVDWIHADATQLRAHGVKGPFDLVVDNALMHGLPEADRDALAAELTALTAPGARMLLAGFQPGPRRGPAGIDRAELERRFFPEWEVVGAGPEPGLSSDPRDPIHLYELERREVDRV